MSNLDIWNKLSRPPQSAMKAIGGGRLKGKSDINPQWRLQAVTELFGPVGIGWSYSIDRLWTEPGANGEVAAFALVSVKVNHGGGWSEPIPGVGGNMLIEKESSGLHTSDEAYKMAVTDALSVAFKALGVAAEVYLGNFDGSKYTGQKQATASPDREAVNNRIRHALFSLGCKTAEAAREKVKKLTTFEKEGKIIPGKDDYKDLSDKAAKFLAEKLEKELLGGGDQGNDTQVCAECRQLLSSGHAQSCPNYEPF